MSLFASTELAARIERAERRLVLDGAEAVARRAPKDALIEEIAGGLAVYTVPGSPLNKVVGLGFDGPVDEDRLAAVEGMFFERESAVQVELSCLADPSIGALLTRRGYVLTGFENVSGRAPGGSGPPVDGVEITEGNDEDLDTWVDVVVSGFFVPDEQGVANHESFERETVERIMYDMAKSAGLDRYLAWRDGEPAGGASMRLFEGVAQLTGAATLADHRRRGVQTALTRERLRIAHEAGCDVATVTTLPGSKSQENVQKLGFELLYTRAILLREPQ